MNLSFFSFFDLAIFATTFTTLVVIFDPFGTIPVFLSLTGRMTRAKQKKAALQGTVVSFAVIIVFAVLGQAILNLLQISMEALKLSGGVLLFIVGMELLMGKDNEEPDTGDDTVNIALVPLGTPLLAGPGAIVAVMVAVAQAGASLSGWLSLSLAVILAHLVIWATMRSSMLLSKVLGPGGIMLLTKIMGLLLAAIATQLAMDGIFDFIAHSSAL